jgi:ATP-dependent Clp protease ATP-binding subunit ClpA
MYERFTDRARKVMQLANQEALRWNHEYIGTEHILMGLLAEGSGVAANVLKNLGLDLERTRLDVQKLVLPGSEKVSPAKLPQTPRAKKVIEYSMEEARKLKHDYVGTEHMLLGLLREAEGVGAVVLTNSGLNLEDVREEVLQLLGPATTLIPTPDFPPTFDVSCEATEDLPAELQTCARLLRMAAERWRRHLAEALAEQDFEQAAAFRDRAQLVWQTKQAMVQYWIANRALSNSCLSFNHGAVLLLARRISVEHCWQELPKLAETLEQAGCRDAEILTHLRETGDHSGNCWVVDLLLAKAAQAE